MRALAIARDLREYAEARPSDYMQWLPAQHAYLRDESRSKMIRTGNQAQGKTTAALTDMHWHCIGRHEYMVVRPPPVEWWVMCAAWGQSIAIQAKFHEIARAELSDRSTFDPKNGYGKNDPVAIYRNGSIVRFRTSNQASLSLAGATIDGVLWDEPPASPRLFEETRKRVLRRQGKICIAMTPIGAPVDWLREIVEQGQVADHHYTLTPENLIPVGESEPLTLPDGRKMDQRWIDEIVANTMPHEVPVVIHGEWETSVQGRLFKAFDETVHVHGRRPLGEVRICIGIDYGSKVGKQVAMLIAVDDSGTYPAIWILDEQVSTENSSSADDARGILSMLARNELSWSQVDHAWGDRIYIRGATAKANKELMRDLARQMGIPTRSLNPVIRTVKRGRGRGRGSVDHGIRWLHQCMVREAGFNVSPRAVLLIEALCRWQYKDDEHKDKIDALRYGLQDFIFKKTMSRKTGPFLRSY
jgi:hypothetical protein